MSISLIWLALTDSALPELFARHRQLVRL